jgi:hypothetical protein
VYTDVLVLCLGPLDFELAAGDLAVNLLSMRFREAHADVAGIGFERSNILIDARGSCLLCQNLSHLSPQFRSYGTSTSMAPCI